MAGEGQLGSAEFSLTANTQPLLTALDQLRGQVEQGAQEVAGSVGRQEETFTRAHGSMRESADHTRETLKQLHEAFRSVSEVVLGFTVANTFGGIWRQVGEAMREAADAARELAEQTSTLQQITGSTAEAASAQIALWSRFGVTAGEVERSFLQLSRAIQGFQPGASGSLGAAGAQALEEMGVAIKNADGSSRDLIAVQSDVIDKLREIQDPAQREYDAMVLLGRGANQLAPLLAATREETDKYAEAAKSASLTEDQVEGLHKWQMAIKDVEEGWTALGNVIGNLISGPMTQLATKLANILEETAALAAALQHGLPGTLPTEAQPAPILRSPSGRAFVGAAPTAAGGFVVPPEAAAIAGAPPVSGQAGPGPTAKDIADARKVVADAMVEQDRVALEATKRLYDEETKLARSHYDDELEGAKRTHEGVIQGIEDERQAATRYYQDQTALAHAHEQEAQDAAKTEHEANLKRIEEVKHTNATLFDEQKRSLEADRDAASQANQQTRDDERARIQAAQQADQEQRQKDDAATRLSQQQEDERNRQTHEANVRNIQDETRQKTDANRALQQQAQDNEHQDLQRLQDATTAYDDQHRQRLEHIDQEKRAAEELHTANMRGIDAEKLSAQDQQNAALRGFQQEQQALQDQHQAALLAIQSEQQADQEQHQARLQAIQVEGEAAKRQHDDEVTDIRRQQEAERAAAQEQLRAIDEQTAAQKEAIDQQIAALQAQQQALQRAAEDRRAQEGLAKAEQQLQLDVTSGAGGDPHRILADQQALADAQFAIEQQQQSRATQDQESGLRQQLQNIQNAATAQKQAIQEEEQARQAAHQALIQQLDDELKKTQDVVRAETDQENAAFQHEQDRLRQQQEAENAAFQAAQRLIQQRQQAETDAFQARVRQIDQEKLAEDDRFRHDQRQIQAETTSENDAATAFRESQQVKQRAIEDGLRDRQETLRAEADSVRTTEEQETRAETTRYEKEQFDNRVTREQAAEKLRQERQQADDDYKAQTAAAEANYKATRDQIFATYDEPKTGLLATLERARKADEDALKDRTDKENAHYEQVQKQIKATYENADPSQGAIGIIPAIEQARKDTEAKLTERTRNENTHYEAVQAQIKQTYFNEDPAKGQLGIIPAIEKMRQDTEDKLNAEIKYWQEWGTQVEGEIDKITKAYDKLAEAAKRAWDQARAQQSQPLPKPPDQPPEQQLPRPSDPVTAPLVPPGGGAAFPGHYAPVVHNAFDNSYITDQGTHQGGPAADIFAPRGSPIYTPIGGRLQSISTQLGGNSAILRGDDGRSYYFAHGDVPFASGVVVTGQQIGQVGNSGAPGVSTHLHFAIADNPNDPFTRGIRGGSGNVWFDKSWWTTGGGATTAETGDAFAPTTTTFDIPSLGVVITVPLPSQPTEPIGPGGRPAPTTADVVTWRDFFAGYAPGGLDQDPRFMKIVVAGALGESGLNPTQVQRNIDPALAAKGIFQFDPHGKGAGVPDSLLFNPGYEAGIIIPDYAAAYRRFQSSAASMNPAEFASLVAAYAELPFDYTNPNSAARRNYVSAFESIQAFAEGGIVTRPTLLVDAASLRPYGMMAERAPERIVPELAGASVGAGGPAANYHFDVSGPSMDQVAGQIRREFERSQWLHQGWR